VARLPLTQVYPTRSIDLRCDVLPCSTLRESLAVTEPFLGKHAHLGKAGS
jgi:hypothetical protein